MRKQIHELVCLLLLSLAPLFSFCADNSSPAYINRFKDIAISEMHRSGIPASITLAQAILESAWGNGTLAENSNNYFGIKCKDYWTGPTYYIEDDDFVDGKKIKSCFRAYESIEDSFIDHTNFLIDNPRYKDLFQYEKHDYRRWAKGLQNCGYATDPEYAEKLIRNIEEHRLFIHDAQEFPSVQTPVLSAPGFNIPSFQVGEQITSNTGNNSSGATSLRIPEIVIPENIVAGNTDEYIEVPSAFTLPDDYERGDRKREDQLPTAPRQKVEDGNETSIISTKISQVLPEPIPYQNIAIENYSGNSAQQTIDFPPTNNTSIAAAPQPEDIIRMSYTENKNILQLSRKPRVTNSQRR